MKIDNMYYNMYYSDKLQPVFNCFSSPNLKSFNGILIPKEERIIELIKLFDLKFIESSDYPVST